MEEDTPPRSSARPHALPGSTDPVRGASAQHPRPCLRRHPGHGAPSSATDHRPRPPRAARGRCPPPRVPARSLPALSALTAHGGGGPAAVPALSPLLSPPSRDARCGRAVPPRPGGHGGTALTERPPRPSPGEGNRIGGIGGERWPPRRDQAEGGQPPRRRTALPECSARCEGRARPLTATPQPCPSSGNSPPVTHSLRLGGFDVSVMLVRQYQVKSTG